MYPRGAANCRERGSEMIPEDFRRSKSGQIRGTPENMQADVLGLEKGHFPFGKRRLISVGHVPFLGHEASLGGSRPGQLRGSRPRISFTIGDFSQADDEATH
jgi:hypothetical protein